MPRESQVVDKALAPKHVVTRPKGTAGDPLITLEAMKMLMTISAGVDGTVTEILVKKGDLVATDDLLARLEAAVHAAEASRSGVAL